MSVLDVMSVSKGIDSADSADQIAYSRRSDLVFDVIPIARFWNWSNLSIEVVVTKDRTLPILPDLTQPNFLKLYPRSREPW